MKNRALSIVLGLVAVLGLVNPAGIPGSRARAEGASVALPLSTPDPIVTHALTSISRGRDIFRYETFGSSAFFSETLGLNEVLSQVTPLQALALGVKVDLDSLPLPVQEALAAGQVDLEDAATTRFLFGQDAVVGVRAVVTEDGRLENLGITCAFCHSTVDDRLTAGVGGRRDGWANRDLDVGAILALSPNLQPIADLLGVDTDTVRTVLRGWGPGKFDAHLNIDGRALRPDGGSAAVLIPPAFGLAGVNLSTYVGWGSVAYWNAFVASHEMNGIGRFVDRRLADAERFPLAAAAGLGDVREEPDLITSRLADLHFYQLAIPAPAAPAGSYDVEAAARGEALFLGKAACADCHVPPLFTEPGHNLHTPEELGIDSFQADRGPTGSYRTTPLRGLWTHSRGGYYHDGRFPNLLSVIDHYDAQFDLELDESEKADLAEFLKSL